LFKKNTSNKVVKKTTKQKVWQPKKESLKEFTNQKNRYTNHKPKKLGKIITYKKIGVGGKAG